MAGTPEIPGGDTTGGSSGPEAMGATESEEAAPPPGTMIVPIAAWDKMLMQLGNLHEAGQQLAEARERAAKAETEATFLRERLAEMRAAGIAEQKASPQAKEEMPAPRQAARYTTPVMGLWEYAATRWRRRRR